uniref:Uncharacterized protein n=1 Tax=Phlebotomus kandelakii TaxID=1109342 RepID=A0A6B2ELW9_9DIPT
MCSSHVFLLQRKHTALWLLFCICISSVVFRTTQKFLNFNAVRLYERFFSRSFISSENVVQCFTVASFDMGLSWGSHTESTPIKISKEPERITLSDKIGCI